jgi:hypothetical protein
MVAGKETSRSGAAGDYFRLMYHSIRPSAINASTRDFIVHTGARRGFGRECRKQKKRWERTRGRMGPGAYGSVRQLLVLVRTYCARARPPLLMVQWRTGRGWDVRHITLLAGVRSTRRSRPCPGLLWDQA